VLDPVLVACTFLFFVFYSVFFYLHEIFLSHARPLFAKFMKINLIE